MSPAESQISPTTFAIIVALTALFFLCVAGQRLIRRRKMARLCREWNMQFDAMYNGSIARCLEATKLCGGKPLGHIDNTMTCEVDDTRIAVFDYEAYSPAYAERSDQARQTIAMLLPSRQNFPVFQMRPETLAAKLLTAFGPRDIDFECHPRFSSHYVLQAENETLVRKIFDEPLLDLLSLHPGWWIEANRRGLIIYRKGKLMNADQIWAAMDLAVKLAKLLDSRGQQWLANDLAEVKGLSCMTWLPEAMAKLPTETVPFR